VRARLSALFAAGLLAASSATLAPSAAAAPATHASSKATTAAERQAAIDYWTPERMRKAVPGDRRISLVAKDSASGKPGGGGSAAAATLSTVVSVDGQMPRGTDVVGKVFFTLKRKNYVCSASSVASEHGNLVLTAGHCLHEGRGGSRGFASNFVFVPAYNGDGRTQVGPYGTWAATTLHTTSQWAKSGDFVYDVGFAVMSNGGDGGNSTVVAAVGTQGITFGRGVGLLTTSYGYPAAAPYDGKTLKHCGPSKTFPDPYGTATQGLDCPMTGGSSGGPWYTTDGSGTYAHSVNSYKYTNDATRMYGPFFGSVAYSLYSSVD